MFAKIKIALKILFGLFFIAAGIGHFVNTAFFMSIMPPYLPWHLALVYISGVIEIILGVSLMIKRFQALAAWGIVALLIAVSPANIHMAMNPELFPQFGVTALYVRLVIQVGLILWAYAYTRKAQ
ncbi:DoxX family protein [Candidatus Uabimicrobium amorphum]|uniref:Membrane protein n=1 Tax=Uabimicrobium amorphum TaxID=2596890 RepID=A0A5S9ITT5_UABAM|nr:DoxX family protein [Candidatus Uabimicrobium amorphum]BBM87804.1 membrane protein [Candidatus Uabimicrobium amorphum]